MFAHVAVEAVGGCVEHHDIGGMGRIEVLRCTRHCEWGCVVAEHGPRVVVFVRGSQSLIGAFVGQRVVADGGDHLDLVVVVAAVVDSAEVDRPARRRSAEALGGAAQDCVDLERSIRIGQHSLGLHDVLGPLNGHGAMVLARTSLTSRPGSVA